MLQRLTKYFFPAAFSGTDQTLRQARIIVNSILLTNLFTLNYALLSGWADFRPGVYVMSVSLVVYWAVLFGFKYGLLTYRQIGYVFTLTGGLTIFLCAYYQGGFYGQVTIWLIVTPLVGTFLLGRTGGLISLGIALTFLLVLWYLEYQHVALQNYIPPQFALLFRLNVVAGLMLIVLVISLVFSGSTTRALTLVEEKNNQLRLQSEQLRQSLDQLRATQNQLVQSEKMASLGELTAGIAHEIQNPLNFVNNFAEVNAELAEELTEELNKPDPDRAFVKSIVADLRQNQEKISQHGLRAGAIVSGMLEHSRTSAGEKRPTSLNELAGEYLHIAYHGLRAKDKSFNVDLVTDFDDHVGPVNLIPQDMGRVLLNVYNNAFYAVQERAKGAGTDYRPQVRVSTHARPGTVELRIKDNGTGIAPDVINKIYQPFFTTKPTGQGTGLGLSLSYDIITKGHAGTLQVVNQPGQSAEFIITLPNGG